MFSQTPNFSWAVGAGRAGNESSAGTCKDIYGNIYVTGTFESDTVYFGTLRVTRPAGVTSVIYTVKYDTLGNAIWVNTGSGTGDNAAYDVTTDSLGNIYTTGTYQNASITFGATVLTNAGGVNYTKDIFLVKYNNAGTMLWARRYGGVNQDIPNDIEIDVSGNILMSGIFASPSLVFGTTTLTNSTGSSPSDDSFVVKMDASGNPIWAKMGNDFNSGYSCRNSSYGISSDPSGNVYIVGNYECNTTFSPITLSGIPSITSGYNIYVTKYNSSGTVVWAKSFTSANNLTLSSISVDQYGYSYIGGYYYAPVTFGTTTLTVTGNYDAFFVRLKPDGTVSWAKKIGATGTEVINKLRADKYGYVTLTGTYTSTVTVGTTSLTLTAGSVLNSCDMFVARYDTTGTVQWVKKAGSIRDDIPAAICFSNEAVYIAGEYSGTSLIFTPPTITNYTSTGASTDMFLSKICTMPLQPSTITGPASVCPGMSYTYSVPPVLNASSYSWSLPVGWTGSSTTNSITVTTGGGSGTVSVTAYSGCCSSLARTLAVTLTPLPALPAAITGSTNVCAGVSQVYSIATVAGSTSYTWTLPSGWTGTSTTTSITATTGATSGNIQVTANNACGAGPAQTLAVTVSMTGSSAFPFSEGFQTLPFVPSGWTLYNPNADLTWVRSTTTGGFGASSACAFFDNFTATITGRVDAMRTPRFDFSNCASAKLKFDVAYARYNASFFDSLNVYASTNCGVTWTRIYGKGGTSLATAPDVTSLFVPTAAQWRKDSIDISAYVGQSNVMFSLENKSGIGQALYLDNVNISVVNLAANVSIAQTLGGTPICTGSMVGFTATPVSGGTSPFYQWKLNGTNVGTNSPTFYSSTLNNNDTVVCIMTSSIPGVLNNPATSNQIIVSVSPLVAPVVSVAASASSVCVGNSVTLSGVGASTYAWSGGISNGVSFVPAATTTYTLTGTDAAGCQNSAFQTIIVNSLPIITASASASVVCEGSSVILNGGGANLYTWTSGVTNGLPFYPLLTSTYTVTGTDTITGCQNTSTKTIIVNPLPVVAAAASTTVICEGGSTILSGSGTANTYTWTSGVNNASPYYPAGTLTYTVTGTITSSGCHDTASITVVVNPLPTITISSTATAVCSGTSLTLTAAGADTYSWSGGISNGVSFNPYASATYTVTATNALTGCQDTASRFITVYALPNVTATSTAAEICTGGSVTLNGAGALSYVWDGGVNNGVSFVPATTQVYTVIGTDVHGCSDTTTKTVVVNAFPVSAICTPVYFPSYISPLDYFKVDTVSSPTGNYWASNSPLPGDHTCANQLHLNEGSTYFFTFNLTGSLWGKVAMWIDYDNDGNISDLDYVNRVGASYPIYSVWSTGYYPITVTVPGGSVLNTPLRLRVMTYDDHYDGLITNGCVSGIHGRYYDYTVYIGPGLPPVPNFVANDTSLCVGDTVSFSNTSANATGYLWDFGDGTTSTTFSPMHSYTTAGMYTVKLRASNLSGSDSLILTNYIVVHALPSVVANATTASVCAGDTITLSGSGALSYNWDNGVTNGLAFIPTATTLYHLVGVDVNGCSNNDSITISVNPLPAVPVVSQSGNDLISSPSFSYQWFLNASNAGVNLQTITPVQNGAYAVEITDVNGCTAISLPFIFDFVWPGDATNDSTVNNYDILPIGIFYAQTGAPRASVSNAWQGYAALNWGTSQVNTQDIKHVDCNGDGIIDNNDTLAVNLNFSSVHALAPPHGTDARMTDPALYLTTSASSYFPGDWVDVDVMLGTSSVPVTDLYGIAFDINYDASLVVAGTETLNYPNSWLAQPGVNGITISKINSGINTAYGAKTRIDHLNADGYGKIATLRFQLDGSIATASTMNFSFAGYAANDSVGNNLSFNTAAYSFAINPLSTTIEEQTNQLLINIHPNPYAGATTISYNLEKATDVQVEVYNAIGQVVQTLAHGQQAAGSYNLKFSAKELGLNGGIYMVKVTMDGKSSMHRIVEMK